MSRPQKLRFVCCTPKTCTFLPIDSDAEGTVSMTVDEYESVRLIDLERNSQEECAERMNISRSTVQGIYESARRKLADFLVNGKRLEIVGGGYRTCEFYRPGCSNDCRKHSSGGDLKAYHDENYLEVKMRIAVTYENGNVFQHFGHTESFKIYDVEDSKVVNTQIMNTNGSGHGALALFLAENHVDTLICGGIGAGARNALSEAGIRLFGGVNGTCDDAVNALLENRLNYNPDVHCNHHDHGEGHSCSDHGEGHSCSNHGK